MLSDFTAHCFGARGEDENENSGVEEEVEEVEEVTSGNRVKITSKIACVITACGTRSLGFIHNQIPIFFCRRGEVSRYSATERVTRREMDK